MQADHCSYPFLRARWFALALGAALPAIAVFAVGPRLGLHAAVPGPLYVFLIAAPVVEELVFRGLLQGWLLRRAELTRTWAAGVSGANVLTSLAFAGAHLWREPWPWAVATLVPSLVFGFARERSNGVVAPCVLHIAYNGAMAAGLWLGV